ncbi:MAG: tRNA lysidine(34) synthetase TilS [Rhizobiaceae bacterium]
MRDAFKHVRPVMKNMHAALENIRPVLKHHRRILLAVSGGGDSVAMMSYFLTSPDLADRMPDFHIAIVDHGLRTESAKEAKFVAKLAAEFGTPHTTLNWNPSTNASSENARLARYDLLARHAQEIGATAIALAHTLDDQAETLVMRARRMNAGSGTRGLSGMPEQATHGLAPGKSILLLRPFLGIRRKELRDYLTDNDLGWVDDPSNENPKSERVRIRTLLNAKKGLPDAPNITRLADLSARTRLWLNYRTSEWLHEITQICDDHSIVLDAAEAPYPIVENAFATLIGAVGGLGYRVTPGKIAELIGAFQRRSKLRRNVGRVVVTISQGGAHFEREARNRADIGTARGPIDGRFFISETGAVMPFITSFEQFRPQCDDSLYETINSKLGSMTYANTRLPL